MHKFLTEMYDSLRTRITNPEPPRLPEESFRTYMGELYKNETLNDELYQFLLDGAEQSLKSQNESFNALDNKALAIFTILGSTTPFLLKYVGEVNPSNNCPVLTIAIAVFLFSGLLLLLFSFFTKSFRGYGTPPADLLFAEGKPLNVQTRRKAIALGITRCHKSITCNQRVLHRKSCWLTWGLIVSCFTFFLTFIRLIF